MSHYDEYYQLYDVQLSSSSVPEVTIKELEERVSVLTKALLEKDEELDTRLKRIEDLLRYIPL